MAVLICKAMIEIPPKFAGQLPVNPDIRKDPSLIARDAGEIAQEVVQHLAGMVGADVEVTLDIQARIPEGVPENVVRTVMENCATLKFGSFEFERE